MIRNSRRVVALAIAGAVAVAPVIAGCGAGSDPQSAAPTQLTEGVNVSVPRDGKAPAQVDIRNLFLLGPATGVTLPAGSSVPLYGLLINQVKGRQDRLVGVSSPAFTQAKLQGGGSTLPPAQPGGAGSAVSLVPSPGQPPLVALTGSTQPLRGGETLALKLEFEQAGSVTINVPVVTQDGPYASYAPVPSEAPSPSGSASPSGSPSAAPSASPG